MYEPDYQQLQQHLESVAAEYSAAEAHGVQTGMLCGRLSNWQEIILDEQNQADTEVRNTMAELDALWLLTAEQLRTGQIPLTLMLPDEDNSIIDRAAALRDWAQGFLYGFGLAGVQKKDLMSSDAGEALQDFAQISQLDLEEFGDQQENEEALMQLEEYLWVATSLIWHEAGKNDAE